MISTLDGHNLSVDDVCLVISMEEDGPYIERSTECVYKGCWTKDNKSLLASLPPGCSGTPIPLTQTMHHFEQTYSPEEGFNLCDNDVRLMVIKDQSNIEAVTKLKLKGTL